MKNILHIDPREEFKKFVKKVDKNKKEQLLIPLFWGAVLLIVSALLTISIIHVLNHFLPDTNNLKLVFRIGDFALGTTIYLKTAIDFAILMTLYMKVYPGWKNRMAIESGTTIGNTLGTILVIIIWGLLQQFKIVLNLMVFYSAIILIKLAYETLEHIEDFSVDISSKYPLLDFIYDIVFWPLDAFIKISIYFIKVVWKIIEATPFDKLIPDLNISSKDVEGKKLTYTALFLMTLGVPFALGLDDFAGYIGLLTVVNVLSFAIGVYFGHFILNTFLFLNPQKTMKVIGHPLISWVGSMALMFIAYLGLREVYYTGIELTHKYDLISALILSMYNYLIHMQISVAILIGAMLISLTILFSNQH